MKVTDLLYEQDEHAWVNEQLRLIKAGRIDELDTEHLVQYLTEMTIRDRRELRSRLTVLLQHLLKVQLQPAHRSRSWNVTIVTQQNSIQDILQSTPSIRQYLPQIFTAAYRDAVRVAIHETGKVADQFPPDSPWTLEQALDFVPPSVAAPAKKRRR